MLFLVAQNKKEAKLTETARIAKAKLADEICYRVKNTKLKQVEIAERIGTTKSSVSLIMNRRLEQFSYERLSRLLEKVRKIKLSPANNKQDT
ncbi:MAG TPA: XRE family transcriptional regulator [Paracoccus sp.]|nr:XRE family transcriptional regulator [Paracoccus sp. (in: a-proteobacteria)]